MNLYHTQRLAAEHDITEAMRLSDYNELILRIEQLQQDSIEHGEVSVSAGYDNNTPYVQSRTITTEQRGDSTIISLQQREVKDSAAIHPSLHTDDMSFLFGRKNTMQELAGYFSGDCMRGWTH